MNGVEDLWQFNADRGQFIYIKKTPVVDFLRCDAPKRQSIRLGVQQFVQLVEAARIARIAVDLGQCFFDCLLHLRRLGRTAVQPPLNDFLLPSALCDPFRIGLSAFRQIFERS